MNRHLLQHKGKLFKCPVEGCNKEFTVQGNMKRHMKEIHEGKSEHDAVKDPVKHVCTEIGCGKEFKYASKLQDHMESHVKSDSSEAFCADPSCMKPFANTECLRAHIRSCHQYAICEVCGSKHLRKNIKRHLRTHEEHPTETFKCTFEGCDHSFTTNSNLQQHVKAAHLNLRPFVCSIPGCGMRFAFKHVRDNHEKTFRHVYVEGDLEELDQLFRSRPRGGRKRQYPEVETLMRKRVTPLNEENINTESFDASDYLTWLLSGDDHDQE